jgi:Transglycosylase SLT domain/Domain of unknown function (DUF4124)
MLKPIIRMFLAILISLCSHSAYADIYEYIDEAGITHYSDTPNNGIDGNDNYVLILKSEVEVKPEVAKAEAVADNPNTTASTNSLTLTPPQLLAHIQHSAYNNQIDGELIHAVMHVESAYKIKAKSHKGAQGLMQLMPAIAQRLGVKNSYDPAQNIEGGAKYLRELIFNLICAAYKA